MTGGKPLVRKGVIELVANLSRHLKSGALDELTMTTNDTQFAVHAEALAAHGVKRVNVSLDTLDPATFSRITRGGRLDRGMTIDAIELVSKIMQEIVTRDDNFVTLAGQLHDEHFVRPWRRGSRQQLINR